MPRAASASRAAAGKASPETSARRRDVELHAELVGLFDDGAQIRRRAHVAIGTKLGDRVHLLLGLPGAAGEHGAAQCQRTGFEHRARRREVIRKAIVDEIAGTKARREQRAREPPVIGTAPLRLVDRPGRREHARRLTAAQRSESSERPARLLQVEKLRLARDRQPRECGARHDIRRLDVGEQARKRRCVRLRVRDLARQRGHHHALADFRVACFQRVEVFSHRIVKFDFRGCAIRRVRALAPRLPAERKASRAPRRRGGPQRGAR